MTSVQKRGPGRPPKKGKPSWKPASQLDVVNKPKDHRLKWVDKTDGMNIARHRAEGWVMVDPNQGITAEHAAPEGVNDGHSLTSTTEHREMILMALPEELGKARDEYIAEQTRQQTVGVGKQSAQGNLNVTPAGYRGPKAIATGFVKHNSETID